MYKRLNLALLTAVLASSSLLAASEMRISVEELITFIKSSISLKQPDRQVAEYLKHVKLSNKLDDRTVEELQSMGAGPKTVAVLHDLRDSSASLAAPPPPVEKVKAAPLPPPDSIEQGKIISEVREYAMNYTKQLPNYLCLQVTRRSAAAERDRIVAAARHRHDSPELQRRARGLQGGAGEQFAGHRHADGEAGRDGEPG